MKTNHWHVEVTKADGTRGLDLARYGSLAEAGNAAQEFPQSERPSLVEAPRFCGACDQRKALEAEDWANLYVTGEHDSREDSVERNRE